MSRLGSSTTGTCIAVNHRLRPEDKDWLRANFIEGDGKVWIAGRNLGPARPVMNFRTEIRGNYSIVLENGSWPAESTEPRCGIPSKYPPETTGLRSPGQWSRGAHLDAGDQARPQSVHRTNR